MNIKNKRGRLKGYMFELILKKLLQNNGFSPVTKKTKKIRETRKNFFEVRGRGGWHQIDCLFDYNIILPFMYPIRMLGEAKYHKKLVTKAEIREFIGVIKDIQENYFVKNKFHHRVTELGVFFSTNGFDTQAEKLAFAHNIKTISYKNNYIIEKIKKLIDELESNYLSAKECITSGNFNEFFEEFSNLLDENGNFNKFKRRFKTSDGIDNILSELIENLKVIKSSFIANSSAGIFLHFLSEDKFPEELFETTDIQRCKVHFNKNGGYWLTFSCDPEKGKHYFTPPKSLKIAAFYGGSSILEEKEKIFKTLKISKKIKGMDRNLTLELDTTWLNAIKK